MIPLIARGTPVGIDRTVVAKVVRVPTEDQAWRSRVLVVENLARVESPRGFDAVVCAESPFVTGLESWGTPLVHSVVIAHLNQGDVVSISPTGAVRTLYRRNSPHNTLFATERC